MDKLFNPKSIAIIGASRHREKLGYQILENLINFGYKGKTYPVNPEATQILNLKTYKRIGDIEGNIDLVLIVVPATIVLDIIDECLQKKVEYAIIITSGFAEIGGQGSILQQQISDKIKNTSLRVVGPNCLGIINARSKLNLTFAAPKIIPGGLSAIFQSGALGVASLDFAKKYDFGIAKFVSLGNKFDIDETDILQYLENDIDTKIIALYLEQISDPQKFLLVARRVSKTKPIIILKGGKTKLGARAAYSHTAAMITPEKVNHALFSQANLIEAKSIEETLSIVSILVSEPKVTQKKLGIITNAGGAGILTADAASLENFQLPIPDKDNTIIDNNLVNVSNPMDLTGQAKAIDYEEGLRYFVADQRYSCIIAILTPQTGTEIEKTALTLAKFHHSPKPIIASFMGDEAVRDSIIILRKNKIPHFEDPEEGIVALSRIIKYWQKRNEIGYLLNVEDKQNKKNTDDPLELIASYNIKVPASDIAKNIDEAMIIANKIDYPVAIKNVSGKFIHKFKAGKVVLDIQGNDHLKSVINKIGYPALIQKMVNSSLEIIVGAKRDAHAGIIVTFGWGGIFTEDINDVSTRIYPFSKNDLEEMINETKIGSILKKEAINIDNILQIIINVVKLMVDNYEIIELDLNPIKITKSSAICVDARFK